MSHANRPEVTTAIRNVAVVGCGLMGLGIAEACTRAGIRTVLVRATAGDIGSVRDRFDESLGNQVRKGKLTEEAREKARSLLDVSSDLAAVASADLVIETALESLPAKQALLADLEARVGRDAILTTNTSSLSVREVGARLARPERFLGLHFFSPAQMMKLVEIAPTANTDSSVLAATLAFASALEKTPVLVRDDPGYVVNRLIVPLLLLAMHLLEDGVAAPESIDEAMKLGCGHPVGPLALADLIGLDVVLAMAKSMGEEYGGERYAPPPVLRRLILANHLGKKTGAGFYVYARGERTPNPIAVQSVRTPKSGTLVA